MAAKDVKFWRAEVVNAGSIISAQKILAHLRGDKLESSELPPCLLVDDVLHNGVDLSQRRVEDFVLCDSSSGIGVKMESFGNRTKSWVVEVAIVLCERRIREEDGRRREREMEEGEKMRCILRCWSQNF